MSRCPNENSKEWKMLVEQVGERLASMAYAYNGYEIPNVKPLTEIKQELGFKKYEENLGKIASKIKKYNKINGTSHSFIRKKAYGNTWELTFIPNYLPTRGEIARQRLAESKPAFRTDNKFSKGFSEIYTPSKSEEEAGWFDEEGNFRPNADRNTNIDDLIPTAASQVEQVEKKRKLQIESDIRKEREALSIATDKGDLKTIKRATKRLERLKIQLEDPQKGAERRTLLASEINKFEDVLMMADNQLKEIDGILTQDSLRHEDIIYIQRALDLWIAAGDFSVKPSEHPILDEFEFETPQIREAFMDRANKAASLSSIVTKIQEDYVADFVRKYTNKELTNEEIFADLQDIGAMASATLNLGRVNDPMVQAAFSAVSEANINAQTEITDLWKELDKLSKKFLAKSGGNFNILKQYDEQGRETGRMVHRFSEEFFERRNDLIYKAFRQYDPIRGEYKRNKKDINNYFSWIEANTINFDPRKLIPDDQAEEGDLPEEFIYSRIKFSDKQVQDHIKELKSHLGEKGYEFYRKRLEKKISKFRIKRQSKYEDIMNGPEADTLSEEDKKALFEEWLKENSPYWNMDMQDNPSMRQKNGKYYNPKGLRYFGYQVPRRYTKDSKATKWYDKNFEKIESDQDLLNYYNYVNETLNTMRFLLPDSQQKLLGIGVLPTVQKSLMDQFGDKGMMMGITPFWDKLKSLITTTDLAQIETSDINPRTGEIEKSINIPFIEDTNAKVRQLVKIKKIKYEQENKKSPSAAIIKEFKSQAKEEISQNKSWDVTRIMKAYSLAATGFKHKSYIEPQIRLLTQSLNKRKEIVTNKAGMAKFKKTKDGATQAISQDKLENLKKSYEYFMDMQFYNLGGRKVEGVTKRKQYTKAEKARKKELEELLENETDEKKMDLLIDEIESLGGFVTASGLGDAALKWTTLKGLGWNLFSGVSNVGFGLISNYVQAADGREYSKAQLNKAYALTLNSIGKNATFNMWEGINKNALKIRTLMDKWDLMQTSNKELFDMSNSSSFSKLKRFGPFSIQERTEYLNIAPVMIATMMNFKALNAEGREITLWDAYNEEGKLKEGYTIPEINGEAFKESSFVQKVKRIVEMNHGDYNNPLRAKATVTGRALTQFRTWMFEGFANRFEQEKTDYILSYGRKTPYVRKGRYRSYTKGQLITTGAAIGTVFLPGIGTAVGAGASYLTGHVLGLSSHGNVVSDTLFNIKQLLRKSLFLSTKYDSVEGISEVDAANLRKNMTELHILLGIMGATILLSAIAGDDDDEEKDLLVYNFALNQLTRLQTDIAFYTNPLEAEKLMKTALPITQVLMSGKKVVNDVVNLFDEDPDNDVFRSGPFKGTSKLLVHTGEAIPGPAKAISLYRLSADTIDK